MGGELNAGSIVIITIIFANGCIGKTSTVDVTNAELQQLAEELFSGENPNLQNGVRINLQGRVTRKTNRDNAPESLIIVDPSVLETPVIRSFRKLFDNYELNTLEAENVTQEERKEENNFIEALLNTEPVGRVMHFLSDKGYIKAGDQTYKRTLRNVWFTQYARKRKNNELGSSGFEHIFVGELESDRKFMGLHNWIAFNANEEFGTVDYWGYKKLRQLGNSSTNRVVISAVYSYSGRPKLSSFIIGTSPELDISLYTLCYFVRLNKSCRLSLGGTKIKLQTFILDHKKRGVKGSLGSAFPLL